MAGRIGYLNLTPFKISELSQTTDYKLENFWQKGGFPLSFLQKEIESYIWRENFIISLIERDFPELGINADSRNIRRLLHMVAHFHAQLVNTSSIGKSLGLSHVTVNKYLQIFEKLYIFRLVQPYYANLKKRLVKSPKVYIRDSGILHVLLNVKTFNDLLGHPLFGASWEGFAMENILAVFSDWQSFFYRTATGVEIDLILEKGLRKVAIEFKASTAPQLGKGFYIALNDLEIDEAWVVAPIDDIYPIHQKVKIAGLKQFIENFIDN